MVHTCSICWRNFESLKGLNIHMNACKRKQNHYVRRINSVIINDTQITENNDIETANILKADVLQIETENTIFPNLPSFVKSSNLTSKDVVNNLPGNIFTDLVSSAYNEVVFWRKNVFMLPTGKSAKSFIKELSFWLDQFN